MILDIPKRIESQNVYNGWHWARRAGNGKKSEKMAWYWHILSACKGRRRKPYRVVHIASFRPTAKLLDDGNLKGGCKPLIDAIVDAGLLRDDDVKSCEIHYHQYKKIREEKTLIYFPECHAI